MAEAGEPLTERELEVVRLLSTGAGNKEIAAQLYLSPNTVKVHLRNIFTKLEAQSRVEVTMIAVRSGWVMPAPNGPTGEPAANGVPVAVALAPPDTSSPNDTASAETPAATTIPGAPVSDSTATPQPALVEGADATSDPATPATPADRDQPDLTPHTEAPISAPPSPASDAPLMPGEKTAEPAPEAQPIQPIQPAQPAQPAQPEPQAAPPATRVIVPVPVAPNPQPLPPLAVWRRVLIVATLLLIVAGSLASLPALRSNAAPNADGTDLIEIGNVSSDLLVPGEATRWYLRSAMPAARARSAAAAANGLIYLIGGETNQTASGDVLIFDPKNNTWSPSGALKPTPAWNAAAVAIGPLIYVAGGTTSNGVATDKVEVLDTTRNQWQSLSPLPAPLTGHSMAALNGKLYVFGDKSTNPTTVDSYEYDIAAGAWRPIAPMPTPRSLTGAAAFDDHIYVLGGYDDGREFATCEAYFPANNTWKSCAPMLIARGGPGVARVGNSLYAVGGGWSGFVGFNERYDPQTNRWTSIETPLVGDWRSTAMAALPTEFYVFGGYSNSRRLAFTYVYEVFSNRTFLPAFQSSEK